MEKARLIIEFPIKESMSFDEIKKEFASLFMSEMVISKLEELEKIKIKNQKVSYHISIVKTIEKVTARFK
jgi:hypothetical protein